MITKDITPLQYSKFRKCTLQNITKHIRNENINALKYVIRIKNFSRFYLLEVPEWLEAGSFKEGKIKKGYKNTPRII